ncbi:MAG: triose-phosphate isomerase [Trueperaceae bacterium]|nr:triose-phosphate isomerase [Trueperaceae bacterium]
MKTLIAANWKMNKLPSESEGWARDFLAQLQDTPHDHADIVLCTPYLHLTSLNTLLVASPVRLGAQDVSAHDEGAYTGEIAAKMLFDVGVNYVIVGHSERRAYHNESDALIRDKVERVLATDMVPILCVGEVLEQREGGEAKKVVLGQLEAGLEGLEPSDAARLVVAYEPVWAIGTGQTATAEDAQEMCSAIREALTTRYPNFGKDVRVLYGGSVKPGSAAELFSQNDIDGGLIGGASLDVASLLGIVGGAA